MLKPKPNYPDGHLYLCPTETLLYNMAAKGGTMSAIIVTTLLEKLARLREDHVTEKQRKK